MGRGVRGQMRGNMGEKIRNRVTSEPTSPNCEFRFYRTLEDGFQYDERNLELQNRLGKQIPTRTKRRNDPRKVLGDEGFRTDLTTVC